ncbi:hypothetical protein ES708_24915 [subsurface metagenome]
MVNHAPVITSTPDDIATVGEVYTYDVEATDPDGDTLTYSFLYYDKPTGMTINSATGLIKWIPTIAQVGNNWITVEVSDGSKSDTQHFTIEVSEPELIEITVLPDTMKIIVGGFETFEVTAHYDNETTKIVTSKCRYESSNSSIAYVFYGFDKVTTLTVGTAAIFISYTQHNYLIGDITKTAEIEVTVTPIPMEIIADEVLTFKVNELGEFTVKLVANDDIGKTALAYFTLPEAEEATVWYWEVKDSLGWIDLTNFPTFPDIVYGDPEVPLGDFTFLFKATFNKTGTYPIPIEVWEITGIKPDETRVELLGSKDITFVVVE